MGILSNFLQDRTTKFRSRVRLLGISELAYLSAPVLIRLSFAYTQFGLACLVHFLVGNGPFGLFSSFRILLMTSLAFTSFVLSTFAFYMTISLFIRDPKTMFRIVPMIIGIVNIYPFLNSLINNNVRDVTYPDYVYALLTPTGFWYFYCKEVFVRYNFDNSRPILVVIFGLC